MVNSLQADRGKHPPKRTIPVPPFNLASPAGHRSIPAEQLRPVRPQAATSSASPRNYQTMSAKSAKTMEAGSPKCVPRNGLESSEELCKLRRLVEEMKREKSELENECRKLRQTMQKRQNCTREASTQTDAVPAPVSVSLMRRLRPPATVKSREVYEDKENHPSAPKENEETPKAIRTPQKPNAPLVSSSLVIKGSPKASLRRALASTPVLVPPKQQTARHSAGPTPAASAAKDLLVKAVNEDSDLEKSIYDHFSKLDGSHEGCISRDACLVMMSLLLEERGLRHCSVPKVICSRILKSVAVNTSKISVSETPLLSPSGRSLGPVLRREFALDFVKQALEFIIDQERPPVAQLV